MFMHTHYGIGNHVHVNLRNHLIIPNWCNGINFIFSRWALSWSQRVTKIGWKMLTLKWRAVQEITKNGKLFNWILRPLKMMLECVNIYDNRAEFYQLIEMWCRIKVAYPPKMGIPVTMNRINKCHRSRDYFFTRFIYFQSHFSWIWFGFLGFFFTKISHLRS